MNVDILSMTAGAGHNQAARALEAAFAHATGSADACFVDATELGTGLVKGVYNDAYLALVRRSPALWGYFYDHYDRPLSRTKQRIKTLFARLNSRPLTRHLAAGQPDLCLCTHFYPAEIALRMRARGRLRSGIRVVLTDFAPHAFWVLEGVDAYYVADEETAFSLARRGVPETRISVTGIPVHPKFTRPPDRAAAAARLGIDPSRFTILVSSGGMGVGPMEDIVKAVVASRRACQVLVVCGRNEALQHRLEGLTAPLEVRLVVFGFVDFMETLMAASDVLVSKCGGLTSAEALATGLPMVILRPIPGQEEQNADFLLERGAALKASDLAGLTYKLGLLLDGPERLEALRRAARATGRPHAAEAVVAHVLGPGKAAPGVPPAR